MRIYNSLSAERLNEIIGGFSKLRIGVAGDFFWISISRWIPHSPR
jgi:hypothetical protein